MSYEILRKKYYLVLESVLIEELELSRYETIISKTLEISDLGLNNALEIGNIRLKYFFVANNLNLKTLSDIELKTLEISNNYQELKQLVLGTLKKVLKIYNDGLNHLILYGSDASENLKSDGVLILGMVCNPFINKKTDEEWDAYFNTWLKTINKIKMDIVKEFNNKFNLAVDFVEYSLSEIKKHKK